MKISFCVFIFVHHNVLCLWWVSRPVHRLLKWKGRVCEFLAILKGDRDANKMPMGDAKLRNVKWFYGQTCMIFKIIGPKRYRSHFTVWSVRHSMDFSSVSELLILPTLGSGRFIWFPKVRCLDLSFSWYLLMIVLIISGHLFVSLLMTVFIGIYILRLTALSW